jgi:hypothetical protein
LSLWSLNFYLYWLDNQRLAELVLSFCLLMILFNSNLAVHLQYPLPETFRLLAITRLELLKRKSRSLFALFSNLVKTTQRPVLLGILLPEKLNVVFFCFYPFF